MTDRTREQIYALRAERDMQADQERARQMCRATVATLGLAAADADARLFWGSAYIPAAFIAAYVAELARIKAQGIPASMYAPARLRVAS